MSGVVALGCKLPNGFVITIGTPGTEDYFSVPLIGPSGLKNAPKFGITRRVPADLWDAWLAQNKTLRYVVDKSIFVIA